MRNLFSSFLIEIIERILLTTPFSPHTIEHCCNFSSYFLRAVPRQKVDDLTLVIDKSSLSDTGEQSRADKLDKLAQIDREN